MNKATIHFFEYEVKKNPFWLALRDMIAMIAMGILAIILIFGLLTANV